jgi:drug/metabolite transporter (DMT)-like permease
VVLTIPALLQLRGGWAAVRDERLTVLLYGIFAVAGAQLAFFNAIEHLSVGVALLLEYSGTLLVVAWQWAVAKQRPSPLTLTGIGIAVAGLVLVLRVWDAADIDPVGVLWGLVAAVGLAFYYVLSARTSSALPPLASAWAGLAVGAVALLAFGAVGLLPLRAGTAPVVLAGHSTGWVVPVLGMSLLAAVVAYCAGISGARLLGATTATFLGLTEVLFAVGFAWLLLSQRPAPVQALGGVVVLVGIVAVRAGQASSGVEASEDVGLGALSAL